MLQDFLSHTRREWLILRQAPWTILFTLILAVGMATWMITWRYQGIVENKSAIIEKLNTDLSSIKPKLDEATKRLSAYESGTKTIPTEKGYYVEFTTLKFMAEQLASHIPNNVVVAVVPFTESNTETPVGRLLAEDLLVELIQARSVSFVDRSYLPQIVMELEFHRSGLVDTSHNAKLGKIRPANILIVGQYIDMGSYLRLSVRIVEVESGISLAASSQSLVKVKGLDINTVKIP